MAQSAGARSPVFLRSAKELLAIAAHEPFGAKALDASAGKLQIALLTKKPTAKAGERALALSTEADALAVEGRELYWLPQGRMSDSDLDLKALATILGPMTIRTEGTIEQIAAKHFG